MKEPHPGLIAAMIVMTLGFLLFILAGLISAIFDLGFWLPAVVGVAALLLTPLASALPRDFDKRFEGDTDARDGIGNSRSALESIADSDEDA